MSDILLRVSDLSKCFAPSNTHSGKFSRFLNLLVKRPISSGGAKILSGIDFEVRRGESVAIIGSNGAGKSTLLKLVTGVLAPTSGEAHTFGSVAALLELGAGFDPEYSGLDNIRMNAALLGLSAKEIERRMDEIVAFADIGYAIKSPVKHYSSGMVVRLGFAVVATVRPDLLITDEVLAVGDESFQKKCIRWIENYLDSGGTLLMVSHNMYQVQKLCKHAIWLDGGEIRCQGDVFEVTQNYLAWHETKDLSQPSAKSSASGSASYAIIDLFVNSECSDEIALECGQALTISVSVRCPDERAPVILIGLVKLDGTPIYGVATDHDNLQQAEPREGLFCMSCEFPDIQLLPGQFRLNVHTLDPEGLRVYDTHQRSVRVLGRTRELGIVRLPHRWS